MDLTKGQVEQMKATIDYVKTVVRDIDRKTWNNTPFESQHIMMNAVYLAECLEALLKDHKTNED